MKSEDRAVWDEKARLDKERFEVEKALYTGPWKIPVKQKAQKDPGAPKRPMSSFLSYSNSKRSEIKRTHPGISNSDASKLMAKMWKEAPYEEKKEHIEREERLREIYKRNIAEYREKKKNDIEEVREEREKAALRYIDNRSKGIVDETELLAVSWGPNVETAGKEKDMGSVVEGANAGANGNADIPDRWRMAWDPVWMRSYYYNTETNEVTWNPPSGLETAAAAQAATMPPACTSPAQQAKKKKVKSCKAPDAPEGATTKLGKVRADKEEDTGSVVEGVDFAYV